MSYSLYEWTKAFVVRAVIKVLESTIKRQPLTNREVKKKEGRLNKYRHLLLYSIHSHKETNRQDREKKRKYQRRIEDRRIVCRLCRRLAKHLSKIMPISALHNTMEKRNNTMPIFQLLRNLKIWQWQGFLDTIVDHSEIYQSIDNFSLSIASVDNTVSCHSENIVQVLKPVVH